MYNIGFIWMINIAVIQIGPTAALSKARDLDRSAQRDRPAKPKYCGGLIRWGNVLGCGIFRGNCPGKMSYTQAYSSCKLSALQMLWAIQYACGLQQARDLSLATMQDAAWLLLVSHLCAISDIPTYCFFYVSERYQDELCIAECVCVCVLTGIVPFAKSHESNTTSCTASAFHSVMLIACVCSMFNGSIGELHT